MINRETLDRAEKLMVGHAVRLFEQGRDEEAEKAVEEYAKMIDKLEKDYREEEKRDEKYKSTESGYDRRRD